MRRSMLSTVVLLAFALLPILAAPAFAATPAPDPFEPLNGSRLFASDLSSHIPTDAFGAPRWGATEWTVRRTIAPQDAVNADVDWFKIYVKPEYLTYSGFSIMIDARSHDGGNPVLEAYTSTQTASEPGVAPDAAAYAANDFGVWWMRPWGSASLALMPDAPGWYYIRVRPTKDPVKGFFNHPFFYDLRIKVGQTQRLAGATRIETAIAIADEGWMDTADAGSIVPTVTIASSQNYPDALAGSFLAGVQHSPLLLVPTNGLPEKVVDCLKRKGVKEVDLLGSTSAIGTDVAQALTAQGFLVKRFQGATRIQTAAAIAREGQRVLKNHPAPPLRVGLLAYGFNFPDALSATPLSYHSRVPILLTHKEALDADTSQAITDLGLTDIVILGSEQAVGPAVQAALATKLEGADHVLRIAGVDRYDTAVRFARWATEQTGPGVVDGQVGTPANNASPVWAAEALDYPFIGFASGENFPDALAGGAYSGIAGGPLLLTRKSSVPAVINGADGELLPGQARYFNGDPILRSMLYGGSPAVDDATFMELDSTTGFAGPGH